MGFLSGYTQRKPITVDNTYIDSALTDFPLLIDWFYDTDMVPLTDIDLNGYNLRFTSDDGETLLDYDRRRFQPYSGPDGTGFTGFARVPSLSAVVDTDLYLYYKADSPSDGEDKAGTWQDYDLVAPLDDPSGDGSGVDYIDVSGNTSGGTGVSTNSSGKIYQAQSFNGSSNRINFGTHSITSAYSVDAWVNPTTISGSTRMIWAGVSGTSSYERFCINSDGTFRFGSLNQYSGPFAWKTSTATISTGAWTFLAGTTDLVVGGSGVDLYINGAAASGTSDGNSSRAGTSTTWDVGNVTEFNLAPFSGVIDELRIRIGEELSADWYKFQYYNTNESDHEISIGTEETGGGGGAASRPFLRRRTRFFRQRFRSTQGWDAFTPSPITELSRTPVETPIFSKFNRLQTSQLN